MSDCQVCDGKLEPLVVTCTGSWAEVERVRYGDVEYFVHGALAYGGATTWWLAPAKACGE